MVATESPLASKISLETAIIQAGLRDSDKSWALAMYRGFLKGAGEMCDEMWINYFECREEWIAKGWL